MRQKLVKVLELTVLMVFILATSAFAVVNMELILDASQSMNHEMEGRAKIDIAKETLINFIIELPNEVNVGLRVYGTDSLKGCKDTKLLIPIKPIDKDVLITAIDLVEPRAMTPIAYSLEQAQRDFQGLEGEKVIVLLTDGQDTCEGDPVMAAKKLAGSGIYISVIGFGISRLEREQLENIAAFGGRKYYAAKDAIELASSFKEIKEEIVEIVEEKVTKEVRVSVGAHPQSYQDIFRLSTGELLMGELLSFDGSIFRIKTERGVIEKKKGDVVAILIGTKPLVYKGLLSQWASKARASSQYSSSRYSAQQATGEPNTSKCGDIETAWAPDSSGDGPEWLELAFDTPVYATKLRVHETYNAGFISRVEVVDIAGEKYEVWWGKDTTPCPGWFEINIDQTPYLIKGVILHTQIKGYEEIDAVELTGILPTKEGGATR